MSKSVCIIDYNAGNVMSLYHAVCKTCDYEVFVSNHIEDIKRADYIILPGVGSYSYVSNYLEQRGLDIVLREAMLESKKPILGICLGMQILFESSSEFGYSKGLSILEGNVIKMPENWEFPLPNIGWREVKMIDVNKIFNDGWYYFAHSYYVTNAKSEVISGVSEYGISFPAVVNYHNFYGVQFHPEKSSESGIRFLKTFLNI